ncbi:hypothetical protein MNBD_NITROSPIRAE03-1116 [hydrothermal vent metagenome]|uniref:Uncharacterized protein n=1 Tax=hydrothermal vent metagenome TaxID=652676 RepID=A0A3B1D6U6_9ZZZZ
MLETENKQKPLSGYALREAGWNALVENLGIVNATRFILQYESGYGDYIKIKKELFRGKSVTEICKDIEQLEKAELK